MVAIAIAITDRQLSRPQFAAAAAVGGDGIDGAGLCRPPGAAPGRLLRIVLRLTGGRRD